jgi:transposase
MERLKVQLVEEIIHRLRSGQSERSIVADLGVARGTIRRYRQWAKEQGFLDTARPMPSPEDYTSGPFAIRERSSNVSSVEPFRAIVKAQLDAGAEAKAIHQRLRNYHGYKGDYSSVRRFVRRLRPRVPLVVVRIETAPGQQAQVDFGGVGKMYDPVQKKLRPAYCFVMTLSWSRHQFVRFVFDQKAPTWLECHRLGFEFFGGVVQEVVIDNLKSAVISTAMGDPVLGQPYTRFARHYGFLVHPCRPRTPEHKGKVENGIHYVQRNFIASVNIEDIDDANRKVVGWIHEIAGLRVHGTTQVAPLSRFVQTERTALLPLPHVPYDLECVLYAKAHRDCHVQAQGSYYSFPCEHVGKTLDVYLYPQIVQLFDGVTLLTSHERSRQKGERITREEHYPPDKSVYLIRNREWCVRKASQIGPRCAEVVEALLDDRPLDRLRSVQGIMRLVDRYSPMQVEAACARALCYGDGSYRRIKSILAAGQERVPIETTVQLTLTSYTFARPVEDFLLMEEWQ